MSYGYVALATLWVGAAGTAGALRRGAAFWVALFVMALTALGMGALVLQGVTG